MHKKNFLICYDISDKKRVSKIGKILEKKALRIQKSIYFLDNSTKEELTDIIDTIMKIFDNKDDDLRVYMIKDSGIYLGAAINLQNPWIF